MKRGRLPLTALRSFEVAGRQGSITRAAEELFISQAAVSRQVRELEAALGHALFERRHRSVELTPAGARLLAVLTRAFDDIDSTLDGIRAAPSEASVSVSAEPSFAACWLVPHLADFHRTAPGIDVVIDADARLVDFRADPGRLAIRFSTTRSTWPRARSRHLTDVSLVACAAPALLAGATVEAPADLAGHVLLHEENRSLWQAWFAAAGLGDRPVPRGPVLADGGLVLQAAVRGQGIALLDRMFIDEDLSAGRLVRLFDLALPWGGYHLVARTFDTLPAPAAAFVRWLTESLAAEA